MYITFLIGNGFDLNLNLETRYENFYQYLLINASRTNIIKDWIKEDVSLWADFELRLGKETRRVEDGKESEFVRSKIEIVTLLSEYLKDQEKKISNEDYLGMKQETERSLMRFFEGLQPRSISAIKSLLSKHRQETRIYNFIVFNYTRTADRLFEHIKRKTGLRHQRTDGFVIHDKIDKVLHVHGSVVSGMITGVNDASQINNEKFRNDPLLQQTMIKESINYTSGHERTKEAEGIIENSDIIYIYGMSLGETDGRWWDAIFNWLLTNTERQLIVSIFDENREIISISPEMRIEKDDIAFRKFISFSKKEISEVDLDEVKNRIHFTYDSNLFKFSR